VNFYKYDKEEKNHFHFYAINQITSMMNIINQAISHIQNNFNNFLINLGEWVQNPNYYYQISVVAIALITSFLASRRIRRQFPETKELKIDVKKFTRAWFMSRSGRVIHPIISIIFLAIFQQFDTYWFESSQIINAAQRVSAIWLLWVVFNAFVTGPILRLVSSWILVPAALLQIFGWFSAVVQTLENYGFAIGEIQINTYTVIKAVLFISILMWIGKMVAGLVEMKIRNNKDIARATKELLIKLFDIFFYSALFIIALNLIGIDLTALTVFGGALGVGIGFGLQKVASNFISGIILLTEKSININDLVEMDDGVFGYVRKFGARASIVETFDGKEVMIPNEDFITSRVSNLTHSSKKARVDIPVGVSYNTDLNLAHKLILEAANNYDALLHDQGYKPACYLREYGDNSINFLLTFWVKDVTKGRWGAQSDVMFTIWNKFKEHNIEIPFPQRDIHIRSGIENLK
jgi:small-conductance mechanosensitive channel